MQEIVWQILHEGEVNDTSTVKRVPFLDGATDPQYAMQPVIETMPSPRLLKTHFTYDAIAKNAKCKYVYIARNPKDVAVSFFKFATAGNLLNGFNGPWEFFVKLFLDGNGKFLRSYARPKELHLCGVFVVIRLDNSVLQQQQHV